MNAKFKILVDKDNCLSLVSIVIISSVFQEIFILDLFYFHLQYTQNPFVF